MGTSGFTLAPHSQVRLYTGKDEVVGKAIISCFYFRIHLQYARLELRSTDSRRDTSLCLFNSTLRLICTLAICSGLTWNSSHDAVSD